MKTLSKIHLRTVSETLSENEMKVITGGYDEGYGPNGDGGGTCGFVFKYPDPDPKHPTNMWIFDCGVSKATAQTYAATYNGNWCCDSCPQTWYCGSGYA